jgi:hypothetical protein
MCLPFGFHLPLIHTRVDEIPRQRKQARCKDIPKSSSGSRLIAISCQNASTTTARVAQIEESNAEVIAFDSQQASVLRPSARSGRSSAGAGWMKLCW